MSVRVILVSGRKGSNPGGKCRIIGSNSRESFDGYFKYCYGPPVVPGTAFRGPHQPIYEAVTFQLAKTLGLKVPESYVLLNGAKNVVFEDWKKFDEKDHSGREFYFVSRYLDCPRDKESDSDAKASEIVRNEAVYLESLLIADVIGKRANYLLCRDGTEDKVNYVDLGCSFVHATGGKLAHPHKRRFKEGKEARTALRIMSKYSLIMIDNTSLLDLSKLPGLLKEMDIPTLNPMSKIPLVDLVSKQELEDMERHLLHGFDRELERFDERGLLIPNR